MMNSSRMLMCLAMASVFAFPNLSSAQNAITAPASKTIGQAKPEMVPSLIVMNSHGASTIAMDHPLVRRGYAGSTCNLDCEFVASARSRPTAGANARVIA